MAAFWHALRTSCSPFFGGILVKDGNCLYLHGATCMGSADRPIPASKPRGLEANRYLVRSFYPGGADEFDRHEGMVGGYMEAPLVYAVHDGRSLCLRAINARAGH